MIIPLISHEVDSMNEVVQAFDQFIENVKTVGAKGLLAKLRN